MQKLIQIETFHNADGVFCAEAEVANGDDTVFHLFVNQGRLGALWTVEALGVDVAEYRRAA